ncbi:hypothetical protein JFN93_17320 [Geomonas sp. Red875]|uniref:Uncharacterized protein n=2 Tax=Geomesophilobacter sediminis TaxID=2798584 RepID=A0A8J7JH69_9BACT|nr:hypothetical protein [Geomesophilobacter sediminis]
MAAALAAILLCAASASADDDLVCNGTITSIQGEGMVARTYRFDVQNVTGSDVQDVLEKCKKIAADRQGKLYRKDASLFFRKNSQVELECRKGVEKLNVRRQITVK